MKHTVETETLHIFEERSDSSQIIIERVEDEILIYAAHHDHKIDDKLESLDTGVFFNKKEVNQLIEILLELQEGMQ